MVYFNFKLFFLTSACTVAWFLTNFGIKNADKNLGDEFHKLIGSTNPIDKFLNYLFQKQPWKLILLVLWFIFILVGFCWVIVFLYSGVSGLFTELKKYTNFESVFFIIGIVVLGSTVYTRVLEKKSK
jgi:hypothetical protein